MADQELINKLKDSGADNWNRWRRENSSVPLMLEEADLKEIDLDRVNLANASLSKANLTRAKLRFANLQQADLKGAQLSGADLTETKLNLATMWDSNFNQANLSQADLSWSDLARAQLKGADLTWAELSNADLRNADLRGAVLYRSTIVGALFYRTDLDGANLSESLFGSTQFGNVDLRNVSGLSSIKHLSPSTIGLDVIYNSEGNIPELFLRGCGVPEDFITYMKSLVVSAIQFYSCFISHSSKDHEFTERLHADLQSKAVRCWFAPEDLKIGDKFRTCIEESIRLHDKLMVVLSEDSIQSSWVEEEVEAALEKERQHPGTTVLFPIRLDDAVMETKQAWAASLRRTRHIGEFNNWKNHDQYKKAFERLLRDLKAEAKPIRPRKEISR
jgi:uncharacterized protein YjbI with pentapeptide repeats